MKLLYLLVLSYPSTYAGWILLSVFQRWLRLREPEIPSPALGLSQDQFPVQKTGNKISVSSLECGKKPPGAGRSHQEWGDPTGLGTPQMEWGDPTLPSAPSLQAAPAWMGFALWVQQLQPALVPAFDPTLILPPSHLHPTLIPAFHSILFPPLSHPHSTFSPHFLSPVSASDTTELSRAVGESVTFRSLDTTGRDRAVWYFENESIVHVPFKDRSSPMFFNDKFAKRFAVSENGRVLNISQLTLEDSGTYSVKINGKTSTFTLHVYSK